MSLATLTAVEFARLSNRVAGRIHKKHHGDHYGVDVRTLAIIDPPLARLWNVLSDESTRRLEERKANTGAGVLVARV